MSNKVGFGRVFWPSFLAIVLVLGAICIVFAVIFGSLFQEKEYSVSNKTVLHLKLEGSVVENSSQEFKPFEMQLEKEIGLADLLYGLEYAKDDDKIKGVFIELNSLSCGLASATELRDALEDFQSSGKFVTAYFDGEAVGLKEYFIGSVANQKYAFPSSMMEFGGMGMELMYFKGLFDKLGLEMQVVRGHNNDFKSAVEPYFRESMSDSARLQNEVLLKNIWNNYKTVFSQVSGLSVDSLDRIATNVSIKRMDDAYNYGLVDSILYRDQVLSNLANLVGVKKGKSLKLEPLESYAKNKFYDSQTRARAKRANVAVIVAQGPIRKDGGQLSSKKYVKLLKEAREDKYIQTIVFRVNSPGGSALASDEIWREVELANQEKTVIVSMGDMAASGGYYIAAPAKRIFASENTITGSIGVFGVIPFTGKALENNLGLSFDRASTNPHAVLTTNKKLTDFEMQEIQNEVDRTYQQFLSRVASGRGMSIDQVNAVARGRVWTGKDALRVGLIDEIGGLKAAIDYAVKDAGIDNPIIEYFPERKVNQLDKVLEELSKGEETSAPALSSELMEYYNNLKSLDGNTGIQARIPDFIIQ